tara:strand:- start:3432 stop:4811 length:1380 start_codon:yes stop_codon:yes gene_type:complete
MGWTSTWTGTFELYDPSPWLAELQIALNERVDIANSRQDKTTTISKPSFLSAAATDFAGFSTQTIAGQIRDVIDDLIPEFANTTDADEWEGVDYSIAPPMPYWTESTLMAALSESRIDHSELDEWNFEWLSQQKRILDELRWTSQLLKDVSAPPALSCNSCSPSLPLEFTVTLSGLSGTIWDGRNGAHTVEHLGSGCTWVSTPAGITLAYSSGNWLVDVQNDSGERDGTIRFSGPTDVCAPPNDYGSHSTCTSIDASDCSGLGTTGCVVAGAAVGLGFVNSQYRQGTGATFSAAVSDWNSSAYAIGDGAETDDCIVRESGGTYTVHRRRFEFGPDDDEDEWSLDAPVVTKLFVAGSPTSTPKKTFNFYTALTVSPAAAYECNDYDGGNDEFSIIPVAGAGGGSTPTLTATVPTISVGDFPTISATDPGAGNEQGWKVRLPFVVYILFKWDVTDGLDKVS